MNTTKNHSGDVFSLRQNRQINAKAGTLFGSLGEFDLSKASFKLTARGSFSTLRATKAFPPQDFNNTPQTATPLPSNSFKRGAVGRTDRKDFYTFTVGETQSPTGFVSVGLRNLNNPVRSKVTIALFNNSGSIVRSDSLTAPTDRAELFYPAPSLSGNYLIRITSASKAFKYQLEVNVSEFG